MTLHKLVYFANLVAALDVKANYKQQQFQFATYAANYSKMLTVRQIIMQRSYSSPKIGLSCKKITPQK